MKINIKPYHFTELLGKGYSLDMLYLLELIQNQKEIEALEEENVKISSLLSTLRRKQLIMENKNELTTKGQEILAFLNTRVKNLKTKKVDNTDFNRWWQAFPKSDEFEYKNKQFKGSRTLRVSGDECRAKFEKIILEGKYTADDLINSLEYQVMQIKEKSINERKNNLSFLQNSLTYLNKKIYEGFIGKKVEAIKSQQHSGGIDI